MENYGIELIIDLHGCSTDKFTRDGLTEYFKELCELIDMKREDLHFWDYEGCPEEKAAAPDHLVGISAIQFISTSNITIHALEILKQVFINIFTCKDMSPELAVKFTEQYFHSTDSRVFIIDRGRLKNGGNWNDFRKY